MKKICLILICAVPLAGCVGAWQKTKSILAPRPQASALQRLATGGQAAAALDSATPAQKAAAMVAQAGGQLLGVVDVALGSPAEQGLWLKSALVTAPVLGRAVLPSGQGVNVTLLPSTGGATLSLSAYRALGLNLTDLPRLQVLALP